MLDYAFDAVVFVERQGERIKVTLSVAVLHAAQLLAAQVPFKIVDQATNIYATFDGNRFYADSRISATVEGMGVAFHES